MAKLNWSEFIIVHRHVNLSDETTIDEFAIGPYGSCTIKVRSDQSHPETIYIQSCISHVASEQNTNHAMAHDI